MNFKRQIACAMMCIATLATNAGADKEENPIAIISQNPGYCCIIHTWGFIGDSLGSGEHEYHKADGSKGYADLYDYSWGQRICAATGTKGDNYSQGGETAHGWINHFWDKPHNRNHNICAKDSPKQAYIIALGVNDSNKKRNVRVGNADTDIDKDDYAKNADTFAGCYGGIIQRVKSISPNAKIFVVTRPKQEDTNEEYNDVIREMADMFSNVYVIDLYKYAPSYAKDGDIRNRFFMGGHMNAAGYQYTAWMMMTYIDWIIRHNWKDFEQTAFIGTDYKY